MPQLVDLGTNWVAVAQIGLILGQNEAMGSRKVFRAPPGLQDIKIRPKIIKNIKNPKHHNIFVYIFPKLPFSRLGGQYVLREFV